MARYNNEKSSWFQLPIFCELGLNIQGSKDARKERKDDRQKGVPHCHHSRTYIMISVSQSCERIIECLCAKSGQSRKCRRKGTAKGDLLWKRDLAMRGRAAPSPDTAVPAASHSSAHFSASIANLFPKATTIGFVSKQIALEVRLIFAIVSGERAASL